LYSNIKTNLNILAIEFQYIIVREEGGELWDGVDGDSLIPLNIYPPIGSSLDGVLVGWDDGMDDSNLDPLDWPYSDEEDPPLALLKAVEEDFKVAWAKYKGNRELLNLKSSVNYGDASNWRRKGTTREQ
jgi:hypothetical protein